MDKEPSNPEPSNPEPSDHATPRLAFVTLGLGFLLTALARGASETFTVFLLPISNTFGWDRAQSLWQLQLSIGLAAGLGGACLGQVTGSLLVSRWFGPRLPTALAVVASSAGAGVLLLVPLAQILVDHAGWRGAYHILGGVMLAGAVPLVLLPWRRINAGAGRVARSAQAGATQDTWTVAGAMRHHAFWSLFSIFFFTATGMFSISVQVVTYLVEVGFPPLQAATAWGFSGVLLVIGMLTVSWLDGLLGRRRAILLAYGITIVGILMLWSLSQYPNIWMLTGFLFCFGSTMGSRGPLVAAAAMSIFRGKRIGTIMGTISIGAGLGSAIGSWAGGLIHDWTQIYDLVFVFATSSVILGMMPFLVAPALRK